jgi:hypothetical protein
MEQHMKKLIASLGLGAALAFAAPSVAEAQTKQDGLVNVVIGDVTVLQDVNIAVALDAVVQACDLVDATVIANVLTGITLVDATSRNFTVCRTADRDKVKIVQN